MKITKAQDESTIYKEMRRCLRKDWGIRRTFKRLRGLSSISLFGDYIIWSIVCTKCPRKLSSRSLRRSFLELVDKDDYDKSELNEILANFEKRQANEDINAYIKKPFFQTEVLKKSLKL